MSNNVMETLPKPIEFIQSKIQIRNIKRKLTFIDQLHIYSVFFLRVLVFSFLISFIIWLFVRLPEPEVFVTGFRVDGLNDTKTSTMLHYNITIHNPDIYKSIDYDVLVLSIAYTNYSIDQSGLVNFIPDGKERFHQSPRNTTKFTNLSIDYASGDMRWVKKEIMRGLKTVKNYIGLLLIMEMKTMGFVRQRMRVAKIYFDDNGNAFINPTRGLKFGSSID